MNAVHVVSFALLLASAVLSLRADTVPIDDFTTVDAWAVNDDAGFVGISADTIDGESAMKLSFSLDKAQWGNAARKIDLPPNAVGLQFDVFLHHAESPAWFGAWLFEADGDGYLSTADFDGRRLYELEKGWHRCYLPISSFRFDPRGNKLPEPLTTTKLLIGLGSARAEVSIANLVFDTLRTTTSAALARTQDLRVKEGPRGRVAILYDDLDPKPGHADPSLLASTLDNAGCGVTFLKSGDLADSAILDRKNFDCLILPYGPSYPHAAFESIKSYLKSGGSFLSMGGYTFDEACAPDESGGLVPLDHVVTAADLASDPPQPRRLNTRHGKVGDTLGLDPEQVGVFDPSYHLKYASSLRAAPMQFVITDLPNTDLSLRGYAACAMLGSNSPVFPVGWGRHVPLVEAYDSLGRFRGPVGAIAYNHAGPYAGSSWAFFGATNTDLFAESASMLDHLPAVVDALIRNTFLHSLTTDFACYKSGETVRLSCQVADLGKNDLAGSVTFRAFDRSGSRVFASNPIEVSLDAGETKQVNSEFATADFASDLYRVTAELELDGRAIDVVETGFVAYDSYVTAHGPRIEFKDNYFRVNDRPVLLSGTSVTGEIFTPAFENPLVWDRDLARMSENGVNIMRVLHFSPFLADGPRQWPPTSDILPPDRLPKRIERQLDALVQLCQRHNVVLFLSLHEWMGVELTDQELAAQRKFGRLIADRYKHVPGFMIDIENEPNLKTQHDAEHITKLWNDFLRQKYATDEALTAAWHKSPPEAPLGSVPYKSGANTWDDMRTFDADMFRNVLARRWLAANYAGLKSGDPDVPVTVGFLQEYYALNKLLCVDEVDFANMHSYNSMDVLRADFKLFDRRFEGKSMSLGEFGALSDHNKRTDGHDNPDQDYMRYLITGHYAFGEGGAFIANWCWKDMDGVVFPWGVNYSCGGPPKDILKAYRNQTLLFRQVRPMYDLAYAYLVVPIDQMIGGRSRTVVELLYKHVNALLDDDVPFHTIDDRHLDPLFSCAGCLIYPVPYAISDETYGQLKSFVERGGTLCITGDVSYDCLRRRTRTDRLEQLCGVRFKSENYPGTNWQTGDEPCINVERTTARLESGVWVNKLGKGRVLYTPCPSGRDPASGRYVFSRPACDDWWEEPSGVHSMVLTEESGNCTTFFVNPSAESRTIVLEGRFITPVRFSLAPNGTGLVRRDWDGRVAAIECQGDIQLGPGPIDIPMTGHFAFLPRIYQLPADRPSMVIIPFGEGEIDLTNWPGLENCVIQTGDVIDGKWRVLSESTDRKITVTPETAFDIRIIAPRDRLPALANYVVSELMLR